MVSKTHYVPLVYVDRASALHEYYKENGVSMLLKLQEDALGYVKKLGHIYGRSAKLCTPRQRMF